MSSSNHATQPDLPLELWARIALYASLLNPVEEAVKTLHALTQVNREFHAISTSLLYRDVILNTPARQAAFWSTISCTPHLWWNVRSILLGERDWTNDPRYSTRTIFRRPSPRLTQLGESISSGSFRWAESFQLTAPTLPGLPIGTGPDPMLLQEVSWWEQAPVGGLLCGHSYSTREEGEWCEAVEVARRRRRERERARTVEDVDLGQGPMGVRVSVPRREDEDARGEESQQPQPFGLDEVDMWDVAERLASASIRDVPREVVTDIATASTSISTTPWTTAPTHMIPTRKRLPYAYNLVTGYLDPNLPKLFESIGTLQTISLTLYPGTLLDHDLLEHQLRLLLDTESMPILRQLNIYIGHDSISIGSRLARITHSKVVQLAVQRVDDSRCRLFPADRTYGGGVKGDSARDVRGHVRDTWEVALGEKTPSEEQGEIQGKRWVNGWLERDVSGEPIQE